jgi:RHS repeat-associated protein
VDGAKIDYKAKYAASQQAIKDNYANFEVPYYGTDNDDYVNGGGFCCDDTKSLKSFRTGTNDNPELFQYYYHSDHLGSSSLITNLDGEVVQHVEYVPFGEVFIEERNNTWNTPYLFNAKELDEETGNYYYSKRYYDPRISIFYGVDPLVEKTGTPYQYCYQNPVKFIDPTGMGPGDPPYSPEDIQGAQWEQYKQDNASRIVLGKMLNMLPESTRKQVIDGLNVLSKHVENFDLSQVAIGLEKQIGFDVKSGIKGEASGIIGNVVFLGGNDAGYIYTYVGGEVGFGAESDIGATITSSTAYFVGYNYTQNGAHNQFIGNYEYLKLSVGADTSIFTDGISLGVGMSGTFAKSNDWFVYSPSLDVNFGVSLSPITLGITGGKGRTYFTESVGSKTTWQKVKSLRKIFTTF